MGPAENNRYFRRELASRDVVTALREYSPGADIVLDGLRLSICRDYLELAYPCNGI